jgi:multiple sugar transport system substrate-binding protein
LTKIIYYTVLAFIIASAAVITEISVNSMKNISPALATPQQKKNITLLVYTNRFNPPAGAEPLVDTAADKLRSNHPDLNIHVKFIDTDYNYTRDQMLKALTNGTSVDIIARSNMAWRICTKGFVSRSLKLCNEMGKDV